MEERRKFVRVISPVNIAYNKCNSSEKERISFSKDISKGGVCLIVYEELKKSDLLDLKIYLHKDEAPISVKARVIWIHAFATDGLLKEKKFYAGMEFMAIDEKDVGRIEEYISTIM